MLKFLLSLLFVFNNGDVLTEVPDGYSAKIGYSAKEQVYSSKSAKVVIELEDKGNPLDIHILPPTLPLPPLPPPIKPPLVTNPNP